MNHNCATIMVHSVDEYLEAVLQGNCHIWIENNKKKALFEALSKRKDENDDFLFEYAKYVDRFIPGEEGKKQKYEICKYLAHKGNPRGLNGLGICYSFGHGVPQDYAMAFHYFYEAADLGHPIGFFNIGNSYQYGYGVHEDHEKAVRFYELAAASGYAGAYCNLGVCYFKGEGVPMDRAKAISFYLKAAKLGNQHAQCNLGGCYQYGDGVQADSEKARYWYAKSAKQGDERAKLCLKQMPGISSKKKKNPS